jgi:hypothetical protein
MKAPADGQGADLLGICVMLSTLKNSILSVYAEPDSGKCAAQPKLATAAHSKWAILANVWLVLSAYPNYIGANLKFITSALFKQTF